VVKGKVMEEREKKVKGRRKKEGRAGGNERENRGKEGKRREVIAGNEGDESE